MKIPLSIQYIDLQGCRKFAWFCIACGRFESFSGVQAWDSWKDFVHDYTMDPNTDPGSIGWYKDLYQRDSNICENCHNERYVYLSGGAYEPCYRCNPC